MEYFYNLLNLLSIIGWNIKQTHEKKCVYKIVLNYDDQITDNLKFNYIKLCPNFNKKIVNVKVIKNLFRLPMRRKNETFQNVSAITPNISMENDCLFIIVSYIIISNLIQYQKKSVQCLQD